MEKVDYENALSHLDDAHHELSERTITQEQVNVLWIKLKAIEMTLRSGTEAKRLGI